MITADEINNLLLSGEVDYIRRAFLKARLMSGYYVAVKGHKYDLFISDRPNLLLHSGGKMLKRHNLYINRCYYVIPSHVKFDPIGLKV